MFVNPISSIHYAGGLTRKQKRQSAVTKQVSAREVHWSPLIEEEVHLSSLIELVIDAEVRYAVATGEGIDPQEVFSSNYKHTTMRQASHAFHHLYRGSLDMVTVADSGDSSLSGRHGLVIRYYPPSGHNGAAFLVRLATKKDKSAGRFVDEKRLIGPKFLQPNTDCSPEPLHLSTTFPVVVMYRLEIQSTGTSHSHCRGV